MIVIPETPFPYIYPDSEGTIYWDKDGLLILDLGTFPASVVSQIRGPSNSLDWGKVIYGYHIGTQIILLWIHMDHEISPVNSTWIPNISTVDFSSTSPGPLSWRFM